MAFTASAVWEVQTGGHDTNNGGGFDTGVSGFPTDGAATSATSASPVFTSASYSFVAGDVGAWVFIRSGSNWIPGFYKIVSVASGAATLEGTIGQAQVFSGTGAHSTSYAPKIIPSTVVGCASTASPTSATWGLDYSQQSAAEISFTDMVIDGATNTIFTSAGNPVGKNFVGNVIAVTSGTGFTVQRVAVVSTSGTQATCDKSLGTLGSTGGNGGLGGALASPGLAGSVAVANNDVYVKSGTYTVTSASLNVTSGCVDLAAGSGGGVTRFEGYQTVRGDMGTRPTIVASGISTFVLCRGAGNNTQFINIIVDGASLTSSRGVGPNGNVSVLAHSVKAQNCTNGGVVSRIALFCEATGCATQPAIGAPTCFGCYSHDNTVTGFSPSGTFTADQSFHRCISAFNTGASSDGFGGGAANVVINGNLAHSNGRDGFRPSGGSIVQVFFVNNIAVANGAWGVNIQGSAPESILVSHLATYNNTSGAIQNHVVNSNPAALTGDPCTNAAGGDFSLNNTAGAGAACRAAGVPGVFPGGTTTGYSDIGPVQHADPAGSTVIVVEDD